VTLTFELEPDMVKMFVRSYWPDTHTQTDTHTWPTALPRPPDDQ